MSEQVQGERGASPRRTRRRHAHTAGALALVAATTIPSCTLTQGADYKVTRGWAYYATVFAKESWEISFDLYIVLCKGDARCVRTNLNGYGFRGWGAAEFHTANNHLGSLEGVMQGVLAQAGWLGGPLPTPDFDTMAINGGIGAGYCMQMESDYISETRWQSVVGPWYSDSDCALGRVILP